MLTRSSRKRNLSGRQTREGSSSSIVRRIAIALGLLVFVGLSPHSPGQSAEQNSFQAELYEDLPDDWREAWSFEGLQPAMTWTSPDLGQIFLPGKLSPIGRTMHRARPFALRTHGQVELLAGEYEFQLRSLSHARFFVDDELVLASEPPKPKKLTPEEIAAKEAEEKKARDEAARKAAGEQARQDLLRSNLEDAVLEHNEEVEEAVRAELLKRTTKNQSDREPPLKIQTQVKMLTLAGSSHRVRLELIGKQLNREVSVVYRKRESGELTLLTKDEPVRYTAKGWAEWSEKQEQSLRSVVDKIQVSGQKDWEQHWQERHLEQAREAAAHREPLDIKLPQGFSHHNAVDLFISAKLAGLNFSAAPLTDDYEFVRRIYLDAWGLIPTAEEVREFVSESRADKRAVLIGRLLADERWAAPWVSYWQDVLAENPRLFGGVPNATGPFKKWIHSSFLADRGYDRFATELVLMEGTSEERGTLGFRQAVDNDVPMAHKALIVSEAFMAANMKCARCHDSPLNEYKQRDLFGIAAMLNGAPVAIPVTSSVGEVPGRRKPLVSVTSKPGDLIPPSFAFDSTRDASEIQGGDRAYRLALADWLVRQKRFAQVGVNRIWKRFMGTGLVEPVGNWTPEPNISHPDLMRYLVDEFITSSYSVKRIEELIFKSHAYQRKRVRELARLRDQRGLPLFAARGERRMRAEEIVDSLHRTVRRDFRTERITYNQVDYGYPKRTWEIVTLSNEEDLDILQKPLLEEIMTLAKTFGWRDQRPNPVSVRDPDPNPLQPLAMANGELVERLVKLTDRSYYTKLSNQDISLNEFVDWLFLNTLSRPPRGQENALVHQQLEPVWKSRRIPPEQQQKAKKEVELKEVTVANSVAAHEYMMKVRQGEPATVTLTHDYRKKMEQVLWVILNSPQFLLFVP